LEKTHDLRKEEEREKGEEKESKTVSKKKPLDPSPTKA
jgi:hypothetical protein